LGAARLIPENPVPHRAAALTLPAERHAEVQVPTITSTIPISKGVGLPTLEISDVDWKKGQAEFGCVILHETRKKIIEVTREYMSHTASIAD
jgi:hypothetical protein